MISKNLVIKRITTIPLGCREFRWCILELHLSPFPFCQTGYLPKRGYVSYIEYTWLKKRCRLKSINHERYGFTFISKANPKFFQQNFSFSPAARADANPWSNLFIACRGRHKKCLPKNVFQKNFWILSHDFQECVSNMAGLFNYRDLWSARHRWRCEHPVAKSFDNRVYFSGKNFKFATLIKFYR